MNKENLNELGLAYSAVYDIETRQELEEQKEFEGWVNSLIEEGCDLSEFTWEELYEEYFSEGPTTYAQIVSAMNAKKQQQTAKALRSGKGVDVKGGIFGTRLGKGYATTLGGREAIKVAGAGARGYEPEINLAGKRLFAKKSGNDVVYVSNYSAGQKNPLGITPSKTQKPTAPTSTPRPTRPGSGGGGAGRTPQPARPVASGSGGGGAGRTPQPTAAARPATPVRPTSSATASTAQKIAGGMKVYDAQRKSGDFKSASQTGMDINKLKYGDNFAKPKTRNPAMDRMFGYQTGNAPDQQKARADAIINSGKVAAIKPQPVQTARPATPATQAPNPPDHVELVNFNQGVQGVQGKDRKPQPPSTQLFHYEWPSAKTIKEMAKSFYEAKKLDPVGQEDADIDNDGKKNTKTDKYLLNRRKVRSAAINAKEEVELIDERYLGFRELLDEATRMRRELGKEGEISVRRELASRSNAYQRSGSVDRTIAAAERGADRPYVKHKRGESDADRANREQSKSKTLRGLAASRRKSVRGEGGLRGYAAKVEGSNKDLQSARSSARSAGTLTPAERKKLGEEYEIFEILSSYLLENNFAESQYDANVIIENMSEDWMIEILNEYED